MFEKWRNLDIGELEGEDEAWGRSVEISRGRVAYSYSDLFLWLGRNSLCCVPWASNYCTAPHLQFPFSKASPQVQWATIHNVSEHWALNLKAWFACFDCASLMSQLKQEQTVSPLLRPAWEIYVQTRWQFVNKHSKWQRPWAILIEFQLIVTVSLTRSHVKSIERKTDVWLSKGEGKMSSFIKTSTESCFSQAAAKGIWTIRLKLYLRKPLKWFLMTALF